MGEEANRLTIGRCFVKSSNNIANTTLAGTGTVTSLSLPCPTDPVPGRRRSAAMNGAQNTSPLPLYPNLSLCLPLHETRVKIKAKIRAAAPRTKNPERRTPPLSLSCSNRPQPSKNTCFPTIKSELVRKYTDLSPYTNLADGCIIVAEV